jgi:hypothetical protein
MEKLILEKINFVSTYVSDIDDWIIIKKELLKQLPPNLRMLFSRRDEKTKKHSLNMFEKEIIDYWKRLTGITLIIKDK